MGLLVFVLNFIRTNSSKVVVKQQIDLCKKVENKIFSSLGVGTWCESKNTRGAPLK